MASADYLKKYLSSGSSDSKKKKSKSKFSKGYVFVSFILRWILCILIINISVYNEFFSIKVVEEDAFIPVKPQQINLSSDEDDITKDVRETIKLAEKLQFKTDGFQEIEGLFYWKYVLESYN